MTYLQPFLQPLLAFWTWWLDQVSSSVIGNDPDAAEDFLDQVAYWSLYRCC